MREGVVVSRWLAARTCEGAGVSDEPQPMRSADRLLQVLASFSHEHPRQTVSQLSHRLGLPVSTTRRLLLTLEQHGFVAQSDSGDRVFSLSLQILRLAAVLLKDSDLVRNTAGVLAEAQSATDESVLLHVLDDDEVVTVAARQPSRGVKAFEPIGTRFAALSGSSSGKLLLAFLPDEELTTVLPRGGSWRSASGAATYSKQAFRAQLVRVRENGYAENDGETDPDLWAVSAPIRDHTDHVVAALTIPCLRTRGADRRHELITLAIKYAAEASTALVR